MKKTEDLFFIGQFVTQQESLNDVRISQAGNNYQLKYIRLLQPKYCISLIPIFFKKSNLLNEKKTNGVTRVANFSPLDKLNKIYRLIFDNLEAGILILKSGVKNCCFYNIDKQNLLLILFCKYIFFKKVYIILADHSSYLESNWFHKLSNALLRKIDGVLVLNSNIKVNDNQVVLPGLLEDDGIKMDLTGALKSNVLLSGSLGKTTGLELALETFSKRTNYTLFITGKPYHYSEIEFNELMSKYTKKYSNIKYLGLLEYQEYLKVLEDCDIALSLRNPQDQEHQFNFPSKILEYLSKSKIVISSLSYKDLPDEFIKKTAFDVESLTSVLDNCMTEDVSKRIASKELIYNYLKSNFGREAVRRTCKELLLKK